MSDNNEYLLKICILGNSDPLKSTIVRSFAENKFDTGYLPSLSVDITTKKITLDDIQVELILVDTAGQEFFGKLRPSYYRGTSALIIIFDKCDHQSFETVPEYLVEFQKYIQPAIPGALVGLIPQSDDSSQEISTEEGHKLAAHLNLVYFETKPSDRLQVEEIFLYLARKVIGPKSQRDESAAPPPPVTATSSPPQAQQAFSPSNLPPLPGQAAVPPQPGLSPPGPVGGQVGGTRPPGPAPGPSPMSLKAQMESDEEDPPTPLIYVHPYPKGPPAASAEGILKRAKNMKNTEPIFDVIEKLLIFVFDLSEITEKLTNDISELNNKINQKSNLPTPPKIKKPAFNVPLPPQSSNHQKTQPVPQAQPMPMNLRTEMQKELKDAFARMRKQQDE